MRSYVIEDIYEEDMAKIEHKLKELGWQGSMEGIYYVPLPDDLQDGEQREHSADCGPYILGLEVYSTWLKLELLVRGQGRLRCSCVKYASPAQRERMADMLDQLIKDLDISV